MLDGKESWRKAYRRSRYVRYESPNVKLASLAYFQQLKRQHSAEPVATPSLLRKTSTTATPGSSDSPTSNPTDPATTLLPSSAFDSKQPKFDDSIIGSPLKKARASLSGGDDLGSGQRAGLGLGVSGMAGDIMGRIEQDQKQQQQQQQQQQQPIKKEELEDEEL